MLVGKKREAYSIFICILCHEKWIGQTTFFHLFVSVHYVSYAVIRQKVSPVALLRTVSIKIVVKTNKKWVSLAVAIQIIY